jgi:hypothetical protein
MNEKKQQNQTETKQEQATETTEQVFRVKVKSEIKAGRKSLQGH